MKQDLGTYWVRVEFQDGRGYVQRQDTNARFLPQPITPHGGDCVPLKCWRQEPTWDDEDDLASTVIYMNTEGNYACDCNRLLFLSYAVGEMNPKVECGETIMLERLTLIRPDGSERHLWP